MNAVTEQIDRQTDERFRKSDDSHDNDESQDHGVHATAHAPQAIVVQLDKSVGKQFLLIIWMSAFFSSLAVMGLALAWIGYRHNVSYTNVLQYDLMDLRAKTGHAHENTPDPQPEKQP